MVLPKFNSPRLQAFLRCAGLILGLSLLASSAFADIAPAYYLQTGHTGSQTFINSGAATDWFSPAIGDPGGIYNGSELDALTPAFSWDLGGANVLIKESSNTSADITLELWDGGLSGTEVDWVSWTAAQVCDYKVNLVGDACSSFGSSTSPASQVPLYFTDDHTATGNLDPYALVAGDNYLVVVTSTANNGNETYYIKFDSTANSITVTDTNGQAPVDTATPEPSNFTTLISGLLMLAGMGYFRQQAAGTRA